MGKSFLYTAAALLVLMQGAVAGPLEDGLAAYQRQDYVTAKRLLDPLAEQGNADAQITLGLMFGKGQGVERDLDAAINWFKQAADNPAASKQVRDDAAYNRDFIIRKQKEWADADAKAQAASRVSDAEVRRAVRRMLKDPESAKFGQLFQGRGISRKDTICGEVNAKNGFGGYTGMKPFIYFEETGYAEIITMPVTADMTHEGIEAYFKDCR